MFTFLATACLHFYQRHVYISINGMFTFLSTTCLHFYQRHVYISISGMFTCGREGVYLGFGVKRWIGQKMGMWVGWCGGGGGWSPLIPLVPLVPSCTNPLLKAPPPPMCPLPYILWCPPPIKPTDTWGYYIKHQLYDRLCFSTVFQHIFRHNFQNSQYRLSRKPC